MSFEKTTTSIKNLSEQKTITLDHLFSMLVCVTQDILSYNNASSVESMPSGDPSLLLKKLYNIMQFSVQTYNMNKSGLTEFGDSIRTRFAEWSSDLDKAIVELSAIELQIQKEQEKRAELDRKYHELERVRGHLLQVQNECADLEKKIAILSDSALDQKAREKEALEAELKQRNETLVQLLAGQRDLRSSMESVQMRVNEVKRVVADIQAKKEALEGTERSLATEKQSLEKQVERMQQEVQSHMQWLENYPTLCETLKASYLEHQATNTVLINAWNSVTSDEFLKSALFETQGMPEAVCVKENADYAVAKADIQSLPELDQWFDNMDKRLNGLLSVYETMLQTLVAQSETLTKEVNYDQKTILE